MLTTPDSFCPLNTTPDIGGLNLRDAQKVGLTTHNTASTFASKFQSSVTHSGDCNIYSMALSAGGFRNPLHTPLNHAVIFV
jgi:hypothetical protein